MKKPTKVVRRKLTKQKPNKITKKKIKRKNPISNIKEKPAVIYSIDIPNRLYIVLKRNPHTQLGGTAFMFDNEFKGYIQKIDTEYQLYVRYTGNINIIEKLLDSNDRMYFHDDNIIGFVTGPEFYSGTKAALIDRLKKEV